MITQYQKHHSRILALREEGLSFKDIGARLHISESSAGRIAKLPPPSDTPAPRKQTNRNTGTTEVIGRGPLSTATLISCASQQTLRIETTDSALVSYLAVHGKQATWHEERWVYEDHPEQLLVEVPGLRCFFSRFDLRADYGFHSRTEHA